MKEQKEKKETKKGKKGNNEKRSGIECFIGKS